MTIRREGTKIIFEEMDADALWHDLEWISHALDPVMKRHLAPTELAKSEPDRLAKLAYWKEQLFPTAEDGTMSVADFMRAAKTFPKITP